MSVQASAVLDRDAPESIDGETRATTWTWVAPALTALFATAAVLFVSFITVVMNLD
jgi:hypothetical protein